MEDCKCCNHQGEDFIEIVPGKAVGDYYEEKLFEFGTKDNKNRTAWAVIVACPKCGTLKLKGINYSKTTN